MFGFIPFELSLCLLHEKRRTKTAGMCSRPTALSNFFFFFSLPTEKREGFWVFWRNKELLREVGRQDFELGSDPVFPVERVEIVLEEWYITFKQHGFELRHTEFPKFYTSSALLITA